MPTAAYILPFAAYLVLTYVAGLCHAAYPWMYGVAVLGTGIVTIVCLRRRGLFAVHWDIAAGVAVGVAGIVVWIVLFHLRLEQYLSEVLPSWLCPQPRPAYNPAEAIAHPLGRWSFVAVRLLGLAVVVPIAEELFWRGFLARWLLGPNWQQEKLGRFTPASFAIVTLLFTLTHAEWFAAALYCALLNGLLWWKRDLWSCIVAHAVSNLLLGIYILHTETWALW